MVRSTPLRVLVTALLISTLSYCSAENVYCVTPTATSCSSCPHSSTNCTTLSEYAREAELYFTSNTTMVFLPGNHTLDTNITVANVTSLTMCGESSSGNKATVVCSGSVGLHFTSMVDFKLDSLSFTSCSRRYVIMLPSLPPVLYHAAMYLQSTQDAELVNCSFHDNNGTALVVINTNITLSGDIEFKRNTACGSVALGGGIATALAVNNTNITLAGNTEFTHNRACVSVVLGGGIGALSSNLTFIGNTAFLDNTAISRQCSFVYGSAIAVGGSAIYASYNSVLSFTGASNFINNLAPVGYGGAILIVNNTILNFSGTSNFINNSAHYGGAIHTVNNTVLRFNGTSYFTNNSAPVGGAILIYTSTNNTLEFNGTIFFINNGHYGGRVNAVNGHTAGGGLYMGLKSTFYILPNTSVYWANNQASLGGAIYVEDASPVSYCTSVSTEECFFQLPGQNLSNGIDVQLVFKNNSADAGSVLYGGAIDNCELTHGLDSYGSGKVFDLIVNIEDDTDYNTTSNISSNPLRICPCENYLPDCSKTDYNFPRRVYPGETFQVSVVAVGQRDGTVPSGVISTISGQDESQGHLRDSQQLQPANNTCTKLKYTVLSLSQHVDIGLYAEGSPCSVLGVTNTLDMSVNLHQTCPPGFNISEAEKSCVCEPRLAQYTNNCTIRNGVGYITRDSGQQFWVGYDDQSQSDDKLILHPLCPYSYCVNYTVTFPLNESDIQCAYNRSGLLCGACKEGYSLVLGTSHCRKCTNDYHLALLIPFAVMGVALVFLLLVCKLTVATGTLSGLVFYANIVGVNRTVFLPVDSTDIFSICMYLLSVFIAWLNLDFGIETCFYNGMNAYSKTWLQLAFPVYIWVLVGLIIFVSHFSRRFAKLLGNNPVSVLATLILLSYTKILRNVITIPSTYLEYPTNNRSVWLYDANIDYFSGKHIPLFIVGVPVFFLLFLPYTLLLLFGQWLQAISHLRLFSWVNRLKPFIDSYHAPYKAKHRYWPGLLLVLRFVLLLVFAFNPQQDPSVNLLAILVVTGVFQMWAWVSGGVYKNWCLDVLEGSFALNLIILVGATFYVRLSGENQLAVGYISVSIALTTFIGILVYHIFQQLRSTKLWKKLKVPKLNLQFNRPNTVQAVNEPADNPAVRVADFSRLRESLLEDLPQPNYGAL